MNIFDQAMEIEKEGESLYMDLAKAAPDKGMERIFTWLAKQERKHYEIFQKMKAKISVLAVENPLLIDIKKIFETWKESKVCLDVKALQKDLYNKALEVEIKSITVYKDYANSAQTPQKEIFLKIAAQEKTHQRILENIIEFVTKPEIWVENAEFSHLDEDYYL